MVKHDACVNLGLTFSGLGALGLPADSRASFPAEYAEGAVSRAAKVGEIGDGAPEHWLGWLADPELHLALLVFAQSSEALESATARLQQAWTGGCRELGRHDGKGLPGDVAHFGYRDGFAQPTVEGVPLAGLPDHLPRAPLGEVPARLSQPVPGPHVSRSDTAPARHQRQLRRSACPGAGRRRLRRVPHPAGRPDGHVGGAHRGEALRTVAQRHATGPLAWHGRP
jgi:hypothetical protein